MRSPSPLKNYKYGSPPSQLFIPKQYNSIPLKKATQGGATEEQEALKGRQSPHHRERKLLPHGIEVILYA
jgi:hypothetical protein